MAEAEAPPQPSRRGRSSTTRRGSKRGSLISTIDAYVGDEHPPSMMDPQQEPQQQQQQQQQQQPEPEQQPEQQPEQPTPSEFQYVFQSQQAPAQDGAPSTSMVLDPSVTGDGGEPVVTKPVKNDRRHGCSKCGKMFNRPSSLRIHFSTHTGERPYPCPFPGCGRTFNVSSNMRRHHRTHVGGVPLPPGKGGNKPMAHMGQEGTVFINGDPNAQNGMMPPPFPFPGWPATNGQPLMMPPPMTPMPGMQMHMVQLDIPVPVPVDPALVDGAQTGEEGGAEEEGDADENGAEGDEGDENTEDGSEERPQLTHTTSNTRGSTSTSTEQKPKGRRGRKKAEAQQAGTEFRQILVPVPVPVGSAPPDPAQYQQQYAQYAQIYAQFYGQWLAQQQAAAQSQQSQPEMSQMTQEEGQQQQEQQQQPPQDESAAGPPQNLGGRNDGFVQWIPKEESPKRENKQIVGPTSEELSAIARALVSIPTAGLSQQPIIEQPNEEQQATTVEVQTVVAEVADASATMQQVIETTEVSAEADGSMGGRTKRRRVQKSRKA